MKENNEKLFAGLYCIERNEKRGIKKKKWKHERSMAVRKLRNALPRNLRCTILCWRTDRWRKCEYHKYDTRSCCISACSTVDRLCRWRPSSKFWTRVPPSEIRESRIVELLSRPNEESRRRILSWINQTYRYSPVAGDSSYRSSFNKFILFGQGHELDMAQGCRERNEHLEEAPRQQMSNRRLRFDQEGYSTLTRAMSLSHELSRWYRSWQITASTWCFAPGWFRSTVPAMTAISSSGLLWIECRQNCSKSSAKWWSSGIAIARGADR